MKKDVRYSFLGRIFENVEQYDKPFWLFLYNVSVGIGVSLAKSFVSRVGLCLDKKLSSFQFSPEMIRLMLAKIERMVNELKTPLGRMLIRFEQTQREFEIKRGSYKGFRFLNKLPARNQRTHTEC